MGLTTKFLVDSTNFKQILDTIRNADVLPDKIDKEYFEESGFGESTDFLVLALLIDLALIDKDGTPTELLAKFRNRETSKGALAYGVVQAYEDLFEDNPKIYNSSNDEIIQLIQQNLDSNKSDIILNYMAKTLKTLVSFVGGEAIESAWVQREREREDSTIESVVKEAAHNYANGNGQSAAQHSHTDSSVAEMAEYSDSEEQDFEEVEYADTETLETDQENQDVDADMDHNEQDIKDTINIVGDQQQAETDVSEEEFEQAAFGDEQIETEVAEEIHGSDESAEDPFGVETEKPSPAAEVKLNQQISYVDKAIIKKAVLLQKLGRNKEALSALDKVYKRYANSSDQTLHMHASIALVNKMKTAEELKLKDQLLPIYAEVIKRLENSEKEKFVNSVDHAYTQKADLLLADNQGQNALDAVNAAIQRFKKPGRDSENLATFMFKKGELLENMDREEEALLAYEQYLERFDNNGSEK